MNVWRFQRCAVALLASAAALSGCIQPGTIEINPKALDFGNSTAANFRITNPAGGTLNWTLDEVSRVSADAPWVAADVPWLSASPDSGQTTTEIDRVTLTADTNQLPVGVFNNIGVRVTSSTGEEQILPLSIAVEPTLTVNPSLISLAQGALEGSFNINNIGNDVAAWEIFFLPDPNDIDSATALPGDIVADPNPGSTLPGNSTPVNVSWAAGRTDFNLLVASAAGNAAVSFRFGSALDGLVVNPATLRLYIEATEFEGEPPEQPATSLRIANISAVSQSWQIELRSIITPGTLPPISISPASGVTGPGMEDAVAVRVTDPTRIETGAGNYDLLVRSGDGFLAVPIIIELQSLPEITISEPPDPNVARPEPVELQTLDFGREEVQKDFYVVNTGPRNSRLFYRISHDDQGVDNPVIVDVTPNQGNTAGPGNVFFWPPGANTVVDAGQIFVTVDRSNLVEDVEFRTITIEAYDEDFGAVIDAVEPATVEVRIERQPLKVEGALNRSRPPFLLRFVFLLRDSLGQAIPTLTPEDLARLRFEIFEDEVLLDTNETNFFIEGGGEGGSNLKTDLVLLLDYSASLLNAGTDVTADPLARGEAIERVKNAALKFIDDMPDSYRVQLMYHYDIQQLERVIHPFSTDKGSLKAALQDFSLPFGLSGFTDIYDAVNNAVIELTNQAGAEILPFDEADVRAVVFITDGRDNASAATPNDVVQNARDAQVRLYPLAYAAGSGRNLSDLIVLAEDTGGHLYNAGKAVDLPLFLGSERGLDLGQTTLTGQNFAFFSVGNTSGTQLDWNAEAEEGIGWITKIEPAQGELQPGGRINVRVTLDPALEPLNSTREGDILLTSNNGDGRATIRYDLGAAAGPAQNVRVELRDPPGTIWRELQNQLILTYITPSQTGKPYNIRIAYEESEDRTVSGFFEEDAIFFPGTVIAGQLAMNTTGIFEDPREDDADEAVRAEVFVRSDYVPRNTTRFRLRFFMNTPAEFPAAAAAILGANAEMRVEIAENGLLDPQDPFAPTWRLIEEGDGIYVLLTESENDLLYGSFGNLVKLTITGLAPYRDFLEGQGFDPEFFVEMRADNDIYFSPAAPGSPSETKYFLYPGGLTNKGKVLSVGAAPNTAPPARFGVDLAFPSLNPDDAEPIPFNPELPFAFDRDEDELRDFNDPFPDDEDRPGPLVIPNPFEIESTVNVVTLTILNNRLDTFDWEVDLSRVPAYVSNIALGSGGVVNSTLRPGASETITLTVDRTGLSPGFYRESLFILTDTFGDEELELTMVVAP